MEDPLVLQAVKCCSGGGKAESLGWGRIEGPENKYKQARTVHETPEDQRKMRHSGGLGKMLFLNFIPGLQSREPNKYKTPPISLSPGESPVGTRMDAALVTGHQAIVPCFWHVMRTRPCAFLVTSLPLPRIHRIVGPD